MDDKTQEAGAETSIRAYKERFTNDCVTAKLETLGDRMHYGHGTGLNDIERMIIIQKEMIRRCPDRDKALHLLDYHYNAFKEQPNHKNYLELQPLLLLVQAKQKHVEV